jgi:hypothetical protein
MVKSSFCFDHFLGVSIPFILGLLQKNGQKLAIFLKKKIKIKKMKNPEFLTIFL